MKNVNFAFVPICLNSFLYIYFFIQRFRVDFLNQNQIFSFLDIKYFNDQILNEIS